MAKSEGQKLKLLYLRDYLREHTDEAHPASMQTLIDHLAAKGICAERKSIYSDLQALQDYGMEILYKGGSKGGYYVAQRDFELPEIKLLIDAVLSSRFLTAKKSLELVRKLAALSGSHEALLLRREMVVAGRIKAGNEDIYANVDTLHDAIAQNRQISFRYFDWGRDGKQHFREQAYFASPYALCWDDENYYLMAHSDRHGMTHYRVDKMADICLTDKKRIITEELHNFNPALYSKEVFGMFRGERKKVKLRFENSLAGVVIDRFGKDTMLIPDGPEHFSFTTEISVSPTFLGWMAGFGGRASIVFPKSVIEEYREFCQKAIAALPEG